MNILEVISQFPDQQACLDYLAKKRWGNEPVCPYCGSFKVYKHTEKNKVRFQCGDCNKSFSPTVGTIFHNSHIPLQKWFLAISMILNAKKGVASRQLARDLDLPVKTAWSMIDRIRDAMKQDGELLKGIVECDETYIGGKPRANKHKKRNKEDDDDFKGGSGGIKDKDCVFGMVERNGKVKAVKVDNCKRNTLMPHIYNNVECGSEIMTDELKSYNYLYVDYSHKTVCHSALEFVKGACHTNTIEGFWSLLKRGIKGQFHHISRKYLNKYVDEFCWRYNIKNESEAFDLLVRRCLTG
ncbi:IS1595 family transposase [Pseudomonadota bacterium]